MQILHIIPASGTPNATAHQHFLAKAIPTTASQPLASASQIAFTAEAVNKSALDWRVINAVRQGLQQPGLTQAALLDLQEQLAGHMREAELVESERRCQQIAAQLAHHADLFASTSYGREFASSLRATISDENIPWRALEQAYWEAQAFTDLWMRCRHALVHAPAR